MLMFPAFRFLYEGPQGKLKLTPIPKHKEATGRSPILGSHSMRANRPIVPDRATFTSFASSKKLSHSVKEFTLGKELDR